MGWKSCRWRGDERENWIDGNGWARYDEVTCSNTLDNFLNEGEVEMKANLGFREQVELFLGFRGQDWPTLRWMVGASGGNLADVVELLVWRLRDLGRAGK